MVTSAFSRASMLKIRRDLFFDCDGTFASAPPSVVHRAYSEDGNLNQGGVTPTTVNEEPDRLIVLPSTFGSEPNADCQIPYPRITLSVRSSSRVKVLPSSGVTPRSGRTSGEITAPRTCRLSPLRSRLYRLLAQIPNPASVWFWAPTSRRSSKEPRVTTS